MTDSQEHDSCTWHGQVLSAMLETCLELKVKVIHSNHDFHGIYGTLGTGLSENRISIITFSIIQVIKEFMLILYRHI